MFFLTRERNRNSLDRPQRVYFAAISTVFLYVGEQSSKSFFYIYEPANKSRIFLFFEVTEKYGPK
jgi:hypothetical protein